MKAKTKPRPRSATRRQAKLTPSAQHYLEEELRWQAELKRKAKARPTSTVTKAARARKLMRHSYSAEELDKLIRRGEAMSDGSHVIRDGVDLRKEIRFASVHGARYDAVRRHCIKRAPSLGLSNLIPSDWKPRRRIAPVTPEGEPHGTEREIQKNAEAVAALKGAGATAAEASEAAQVLGAIANDLETPNSLRSQAVFLRNELMYMTGPLATQKRETTMAAAIAFAAANI